MTEKELYDQIAGLGQHMQQEAAQPTMPPETLLRGFLAHLRSISEVYLNEGPVTLVQCVDEPFPGYLRRRYNGASW